jgi:serine/threonine-protein kinase
VRRTSSVEVVGANRFTHRLDLSYRRRDRIIFRQERRGVRNKPQRVVPEFGVRTTREAASSGDPLQLSAAVLGGRARVEQAVAEGGFGVIYKATHLELARAVAVKCLKVPETVIDPRDRDRLVSRFREATQAAQALDAQHASFVHVLEVAATTTLTGQFIPYMLLEWLEGETLDNYAIDWSEKLGRRPTIAELVTFLDPVVKALAAAHERGIVHLDLKPGNFFVSNPATWATVKLLDFGVAKVFQEEHTTARGKGVASKILGFTPAYGAPEQLDASLGPTGTFTDVFGLALVMVELLTGQPALDGEGPDEYLASATQADPRPTPGVRGAHVSTEVEAVFARALAVRPDQRTRDVGTFWRELVAASGGAKAEVRRAAAPGQIADPAKPRAGASVVAAPAATAASPGTAAPAGARSGSRVLVGIALVVAVALLGGGAFVLMRMSEEGPTRKASSSDVAPSSAAAPSAPVSARPITVESAASAVASAPPAPKGCALKPGVRVEVVHAATDADWGDLPVARRFPSLDPGYVDAVQKIEGSFFSPSRTPHLLIPCGVVKEVTVTCEPSSAG